MTFKKLFILLALSLISTITFAQSNLWAPPWCITNAAPTFNPGSKGCRIVLDTTDQTFYLWKIGTTWVEIGKTIDEILGCVPPAYTPTKWQSSVVLNDCDSLYRYRSGVWYHLNPPDTDAQNLSLTGQSLGISGGTGVTLPVVGATASDFDLASGVLSLDYTNAQKATALVPGFLTAADWATFNAKGNGTVTSVGLDLPAELTESGTPVTGAGTLSATWAAQAANLVFRSGNAGGTPSFSALTAADIPALTYEVPLTFSTGLTRTANTISSNLSTGIAGSQSVIGGTASGETLTLSSTSHATKGKILFGTSAYDEVNNRLGIGTSTPASQLDISSATGAITRYTRTATTVNASLGQLNFYNGATRAAIIDAIGDGAADAGAFDFYTTPTGGSVTQRMRITSAGNVGVGTLAPFSGAGFTTVALNGVTASLLDLKIGDVRTASFYTSASGAVLQTITSIPITFYTAGVRRMDISSAGFVGIGATTPDRLLHAESNDAATATVTFPTRVTHITSGTATTGFGAGMEVELENGSGTNRVAMTEEVTYADAVDGTEDATWKLWLMRAGTLTEAISVNSTGIFQFGGATSAFPALKRSGTGLEVRLADDSNYAPFTCNTLLTASLVTSNGGFLAPGGGTVYLSTGTSTITSGSFTPYSNVKGFAPTSGTGAFTGYSFTGVLNQTGSASGTIVGFDYNPTVTSVLGSHYAALFRAGNVGIGNAAPTEKLEVTGNGKFTGTLASTRNTATLAAAATTLAITRNVTTVTGDAGGNTLVTITGGQSGQILTLIFVDALVTITDDGSGTANTVNLSAAFTSTAGDVLTLVFDGTSWYETQRSIN